MSRYQVQCERVSETSPVMQLNKHIFRSQSRKKCVTDEASFFRKHCKFKVDLRN